MAKNKPEIKVFISGRDSTGGAGKLELFSFLLASDLATSSSSGVTYS